MNAAAMTSFALPEEQRKKLVRLTLLWMTTMMVLFPLLASLGYFMRLYQAQWINGIRPEWFYAVLTLHGLGMVGTWFVGAMAAVSYLLARYVQPSLFVSRLAFVGTVAGVGLLIAATLGGLFGTGWYFLYPLPFYSQGVWPGWATGCFFGSLAVLGVAWLLWSVDLLAAIARRYRLSHALAWHVLRGESEPSIPPLVLIVTVSLIALVSGLVAGVIVLALFGAEWLVRGFANDALLMKNLIFFFGHIVVNITMYLGVAVVYEALPQFAGRPWKTSRVVAVAWNAVLLLVILAYFHHLYMDFAQPLALQQVGQISSYLISVPAAVVSIFGGLALIYRAPMRWTLASALLFFGLMGWAIGGAAAVIDSTVAVNFRFHNTLWVPAHFHSYYLMGVVLMLLGFAHNLGVELAGRAESALVRGGILGLLFIGGYGFLWMFYWAGAHSIPRRYAIYPNELSRGTHDAAIAVIFISLVLLAALVYLWDTGRRYLQALRT